MTPPDVALRELAGQVAARLVAEALSAMVGARPADITVSVRKALPPAPQSKRAYTRRPKPTTVAAKLAAAAAKLRDKSAATPKASGSGESSIADRRCRHCLKTGTAVRVAGTEKSVKCSACGHVWNVRNKYQKANGHAGAPLTAEPCGRCDHAKALHEMGSGACTAKRCVCREFYS